MAWTGRGGRSVRRAWLLIAAGTCVGVGTLASAQDQPTKAVEMAPTRPLTGHDFAGVRFKQVVTPGKLEFHATKAWSWTDGTARRLVLDGDVTVTMAGYHFSAKRAAVWMETVPGAAGKDTEQVFVYFDQLGSASDPASSLSMSSDRLPVRGVIGSRGTIELKNVDMRVLSAPGAGEASFVADGEAALVKTLKRELGIPDDTPPPAACRARGSGPARHELQALGGGSFGRGGGGPGNQAA